MTAVDLKTAMRIKHARVAPGTHQRVHAVPMDAPIHLRRRNHQRSVCGAIPHTDYNRWGDGRWRWTDEPVSCRRCLELGAGR